MNASYLHTAFVALLALGVAAGGYYLTDVRQANELEKLAETRKLHLLEQQALSRLAAEADASVEQAGDVARRWRQRYKHIPDTITTADVVEYLERLPDVAFQVFDLRLEGHTARPHFSYLTFDVEGTGPFADVHRFVHHMENSRALYRVDALEVEHRFVFDTNRGTGHRHRRSMVDFSCRLVAFFGGIDGLSAAETPGLPSPEVLLAAPVLRADLFEPLFTEEKVRHGSGRPQLLDVETATLTAIVGYDVVFKDRRGLHRLAAGDAVRGGRIDTVDPASQTVYVRLDGQADGAPVILRLPARGLRGGEKG